MKYEFHGQRARPLLLLRGLALLLLLSILFLSLLVLHLLAVLAA